MDSPASERARRIFSSPTSDLMRYLPPRRRRRIRSVICPSELSRRSLICTVLYILVAAVLTGMVPWQQVNIEAPIAQRVSGSRTFDRIEYHHLGRACRPHKRNVGHVARADASALLDGQRRLASAEIFRRHPSQMAHAVEEHHLVGLIAAVVGSLTPIDDIGKMVNIGTLLAFVIVCIAVMVLRRTNPNQPRPFRTPWVPLVPDSGRAFQWLYDVQAGVGELGAIVHLARNWIGCVFHLWRQAQPGSGAASGFRSR